MKTFLLFCIVFIAGFALIPDVHAQTFATYKPMVEIPRLDPDTQTTDQYVNALYILSIVVAAFLAVVKIIFGGVKWMLSDVVTDKSSAKKDIWGAITGLLIVLAAVIVLNTINPNLTRFNFLGNAEPISINLSSSGSSGSSDDSEEADSCIVASDCTEGEVYLRDSNSICGQCVPEELASDPGAQNQAFNYNTVKPNEFGIYLIEISTLEKLDVAQVLNTFENSCIANGFLGQVTHGQDPENPEYYKYSCAG